MVYLMGSPETSHRPLMRGSRRTYLYLVLAIVALLIMYNLPSTSYRRIPNYNSVGALDFPTSPEELELDLQDTAPLAQPSIKTSPSPHNNKNEHTPVEAPEEDLDDEDEAGPINNSGHYNVLVVIASPKETISRRRLIREHYFGLRDNLLPCMRYDTNVIYKFWVYGGREKMNNDSLRKYAAERIEWDDIVEREDEVFEQWNVIKWAEEELKKEGITYNYLVLQDIHTFLHLSSIVFDLSEGVIGLGTDSPFQLDTEFPTDIVWGSFTGTSIDKKTLIVGQGAAAQAIEELPRYSEDQEPEHVFTQMYHYYTSQDEETREGPDFVREDGEDGTNRFNPWENSVESVHHEDVAVTDVYQDEEFRDLARWTYLRPTLVCHARRSASDVAPLHPIVDEDEPATDFNATDHRPAPALDNTVDSQPLSIAILTSSYVYPDLCMLDASYPAAQNKRDYALRHGYAFVARSLEFAQQGARGDRTPVWGKVDSIEKVLPKYDWVFWMDMDAVVMNPEINIESLLEEFERMVGGKEAFAEKHLIVAKPKRDKMINAGVLLIRNSEWSKRFIRAVNEASDYYTIKPSFEQLAMWDLMKSDEWRDGVLSLLNDDHTFNTFPNKYQPGYFVVHYAPDSCPREAVLRGLDFASRIAGGEKIMTLE
ncbi:hypothetical protein BC938DRAFT_479444 [Jimgerdemannia flammicorona]|uniref:Galactosyl transferase GMA12/MNN10 family-domain-containing protein n=1 Tax=Jimgerdemannia flammicorona TaxID=994334 RepID=A0A433QKS5_9FUNG|nr:hypothetical protein BC938DRAFT_479444 [Jimgerdemannia flammicorona]RUS30393.1 hypothetical protein BC938DRAFT_479444 [Jimgerdemannia flammicorona]